MLKTKKKALLIAVFIILISTFTFVLGTEEAPAAANETPSAETAQPQEGTQVEGTPAEGATETPQETQAQGQEAQGTTEQAAPAEPETKTEVTKAKVLSAGEVYEETTGDIINQVQNIRVKILSGEHEDKAFDSKYIISQDIDNKITAYPLEKGDTVFVEITQTGTEVTSVVTQDLVRQTDLIYIISAFFVLVFIIGGIKGLKSIIALVITVVIIYFVTVKWILSGGNPIVATIVTSALTIALTFIIVSGFNKKSLTASIGTIGGIVFSGVMAIIFGNIAKLSGFQEEAVYLSIHSGEMAFNFREILYARNNYSIFRSVYGRWNVNSFCIR